MRKKQALLIVVVLVLTTVLAACSPGGGGGGQANGGNAGNAQPGAANVGNGGALPVAEDVGEKWPEDIPLHPEAYDIDVARNATQLNFKVPVDVEGIMTYLQGELPPYGWTTEVTPDSAVGNIATMLRQNEAGNRMAINIQYNQLGDFVTIAMSITREGN